MINVFFQLRQTKRGEKVSRVVPEGAKGNRRDRGVNHFNG